MIDKEIEALIKEAKGIETRIHAHQMESSLRPGRAFGCAKQTILPYGEFQDIMQQIGMRVYLAHQKNEN